MTFEEIKQVIEGMLSVQRELQASQLELKQNISDLSASVANLNEISRRHERRIEQLIGYSITGESDRLDLTERLQNLERRVNRLERENNSNSNDN
ncbi:MAG: hypothetical protein JOZ78_17475 [Chroococcidiopsidaceae cyanobacterium CP_BM_ER_R8_30]|nr:hypothetical protein [Chroococcidiopsidaceae cyanobacterium CP_BM_ER_R8_30]